MQIPSSFYGLYKDIKPQCRKMLTGLINGQKWNEVVKAKDTIDTTTKSGLIVLHGPNPLLGGSPHFHCYFHLSYVLNAISEGKLPPEIEEEIFVVLLQTPWGLLNLLSQTNVMWVYPQERHKPFLSACLMFWDILIQEGNRYSNGSNNAQSLWTIHTNVKYVLANEGISTEILNAPLPAGGLVTLTTLM